MNNILLNIGDLKNLNTYNAIDKPREDVNKTLKDIGYKIININIKFNSIRNITKFFIELSKLSKILKRGDNIIMQYPFKGFGTKLMYYFSLLFNTYNITYLIHDIQSLGSKGKISKREVFILNRAKKLLVHTNNMMEYLQSEGVISKMQVMWLFDYYGSNISNDFNCAKELIDHKSIIFAGNLDKSKFLKKIDASKIHYPIYLYGKEIDYKWPDVIRYSGKFNPNEISNLLGAWGLVWDGPDIENCTSNIGNYLRYNSSHKASLYLAAGKPIIVWEESGLAPFVKENKIGISIKSITDINTIFKKINKEEYQQLLINVKSLQQLILEGGFLRKLISENY
ncbi:MAG: hypothetical protein J1F67_11075 [Muribaculaceae bacterium]|nr:hypothetical protein [Muribaculaceae bacterium]